MSNNVIQLTSKFVKLSMIKSVTVLSLHTEVLEVLVDVEVTLVDVEVQEDLLSLVMALLLPLHVDLYHDRSAKTFQDNSAKMLLNLFQDKNAAMSPGRNAEMFQNS